MPTGRGSIRRRGSPDLDNNPYNSQSLAAGGSALLDAINRGKVHLAKFILDAGEYDVANTKDFKGKTPLIRACYIREQSTRDRAVRLLLSKGADVNIQDDSGRTALSYACELRCNDVVRILVKNNVDPDIPDYQGNTPLMYSAMIGNDTAINILIRSFRRLGLQVDYINNDGHTSLLLAAKHGNIACASMLAIDGRACISFRDREKGMNAEEWARAHGCATPEVMPFSTNALVYQQKFGRSLYPHKLEDDDDDARRTHKGQPPAEECAVASYGFERDEPPVDETKLRSQLQELRVGSGERRLLKRGSLPTMKISSGPLRNMPSPVLKEEESESSKATKSGDAQPLQVKDAVNKTDQNSNRSSNPSARSELSPMASVTAVKISLCSTATNEVPKRAT